MDVEERIAAMAPQEPNVLALYEAVKELQSILQLPADVELSPKNNIQAITVLRRKNVGKYSNISYNISVDGDSYVNAVQVSADRYKIVYHTFVSAVYGFCDLVPSSNYRAQPTIRGE